MLRFDSTIACDSCYYDHKGTDLKDRAMQKLRSDIEAGACRRFYSAEPKRILKLKTRATEFSYLNFYIPEIIA